MGCWLSSWRMLRRLGLQAVQVLRTADIPIFNGTVVAETEDYEVVEGNVYFQPESIKQEYFSDSGLNTSCPWKGLASYYSVSVDGQEARDVTWRGITRSLRTLQATSKSTWRFIRRWLSKAESSAGWVLFVS